MKKTIYVFKQDNTIEIEVQSVAKDTVIKTEYGDALVTAGNFIAVNIDSKRKGQCFGITEQDLNTLYVKK